MFWKKFWAPDQLQENIESTQIKSVQCDSQQTGIAAIISLPIIARNGPVF
jgi:hypothetical protein